MTPAPSYHELSAHLIILARTVEALTLLVGELRNDVARLEAKEAARELREEYR